MVRMHIRRGGRPFNRHALELWLNSPRGRRWLTLEEAEVRRVLPEIFGRHLLQIGSWGRGDELIASSEMLHHAVLGTVSGLGAQALSAPEDLPVLTKSVDAVLLPHTLEYVPSPHNVLRESNRILTDRGRLFILGFNPWSTWTLRQRLGLRHRALPSSGRFYGVGRVSDWLELLDFEVAEVRRFSIGFPWLAATTDTDAWHLDSLLARFSEGYLIVAKKRVIPVNRIGFPLRAQVRPLLGGAIPAQANTTPNACSVELEPPES